jgi:hypothetical protein
MSLRPFNDQSQFSPSPQCSDSEPESEHEYRKDSVLSQKRKADTALPAKTVALDEQDRGPYPTDGKEYFWMADEKKWVSSVPLRDEVIHHLGYIHFNAKTRVVDTVNDVRTCFLGAVMEYYPKHSRKYRLQKDKEATDRLNTYHLNQAKQELPEGCKLVLITTKTRKAFEFFVDK